MVFVIIFGKQQSVLEILAGRLLPVMIGVVSTLS
jgi:hypothetical protein